MKAIIELRKTGYYVTHADDSSYRDDEGHMWFSQPIARDHARRIGGMYHDGARSTVKEVVTGYEAA